MRALRCQHLQGGAAGGAARAPAVSAPTLPSGGARAAPGVPKSACCPAYLQQLCKAAADLGGNKHSTPAALDLSVMRM